MKLERSDFPHLTYFLAIARHRNFRLAGLELGVSASAMSHALKGLEARLGVRLLNRTNRSVTLTAIGEELRAEIDGPFDAIGLAVERLNRYRDAPAGRIRLNVAGDAAELLLGPVLPLFVERYPDIEVEIAASNRMVDVTEGGFDAGIRYGGTVPVDMVAQRLSADLRWAVAGSPRYVERFGIPTHPADLRRHQCLRTSSATRSYTDGSSNGEASRSASPSRVRSRSTRRELDWPFSGAAAASCTPPKRYWRRSPPPPLSSRCWKIGGRSGRASTSTIPAGDSCPSAFGCSSTSSATCAHLAFDRAFP